MITELQERTTLYKDKFFAEARDNLRSKEAFKSILEDNKLHIQQIASLEKRVQDLECKAKEDI